LRSVSCRSNVILNTDPSPPSSRTGSIANPSDSFPRKSANDTFRDDHIGILDGLRGAMAFWVFYGHLQIACLGTVPRFGHPANAVDVFMFLSGFLMTYHWLARERKFQSGVRQSVDFYTRRFFRIAPLYYLVFTVAFLGRNYFFQVTHPGATAADVAGQGRHAVDALAHYSFLFGAFPKYVSNNILPDWSIGLEMQFYLFFPLLLLAALRLGSLTTIGLTVVVTYVTNHLFSLYDNPARVLGNFPQPGLLFFKLDIFMAGICLAYHYRDRANVRSLYWLLLGCICLLRTSVQVKGIIFGTMCLIHFDQRANDFAHRLLTSALGKFAGDTSYSVYLVHVLILYPVLSAFQATSWYPRLPDWKQLALCLVAVTLPLYSLAALLHRLVETPGIALGRRVAVWLDARLFFRPVVVALPDPSSGP